MVMMTAVMKMMIEKQDDEIALVVDLSFILFYGVEEHGAKYILFLA